MLTRAGAGAVYVAIVLLGILGGRFVFLGVFALFTALALYEFYRMVEEKTTHPMSKPFNIISGVVIFGATSLSISAIDFNVLPIAVLLYILALLTSAIFVNRPNILQTTIYSIFGQLYITLPLCLLMYIARHVAATDVQLAYLLVLAIFVFIWINDTGAYLVGSMIGKRKLIERISPKKSIEGFVGGLVLTALSALLFAPHTPQLSIGFWVGFAVLVSVFGTLGDLFESLLKRNYKLKDSGHLIPGHGGILDRIDSLLLAIPAVFVYLLWLGVLA